MIQTRRPAELLSKPFDSAQLPPPRWDPFKLDEALAETEVHGVAFDVLRGEAAVLLLLSGLATYETDNTGLLLFSGVSQFLWEAPAREAGSPPAHLTVLPAPMLDVARASIAGKTGATEGIPPSPPVVGDFHSWRMVLHPWGSLRVRFSAALYMVGRQTLADERDPYVLLDADTHWNAASRWPR